MKHELRDFGSPVPMSVHQTMPILVEPSFEAQILGTRLKSGVCFGSFKEWKKKGFCSSLFGGLGTG